MPRQARVTVADTLYHVINRSNGGAPIFITDKDYVHFESLLLEAKELTGMRILAYCIMPNHFHLILQPQTDTDLAEFMGWLTTTHVRQYRTRTETVGRGHLYQDRYKSFPVQSERYALTLLVYIEQNPLRAKLVQSANEWRWSSLWRREKGSQKDKKLLDPLPFEVPNNYMRTVNEVLPANTVAEIRYSVTKGKPLGTAEWVEEIVERFKLSHTIRGPGRPRK